MNGKSPNTAREVRVAAVQMDATPGELESRLSRAEVLVTEAASSGAQLVVLPEVFNTGYHYDAENYKRAEAIDGPTCAWMRWLAARLDIYITGTLLLRRDGDIYNTMLLVAPDGQEWQYDKRYPFYWERAYFRGGTGITVADTKLGKLGMMICWDVSHADLFREYAGQVEAMLVSSCPPRFTDADLVFPDGYRVNVGEMSPLAATLARRGRHVFDQGLKAQAAYLSVPMVHATGTGAFSSRVPRALLSMLNVVLLAPRMWGRLRQAHQAHFEADYFDCTFVLDAEGNAISESAHGKDTFVVGDVTLRPPHLPVGQQPKMRLPRLSHTLDSLVKALVRPIYRRHRSV